MILCEIQPLEFREATKRGGKLREVILAEIQQRQRVHFGYVLRDTAKVVGGCIKIG